MKPTRAQAAVVSLLAGLVAGPAGAGLLWGPGAALLLASAQLILVAILLGWGA